MSTPISKQTLQAFLFDCGFADVRATGSLYALPSIEWIRDIFAPALHEDLKEYGMDRFVKGKNTCTKFARHAAWFGGLCHLETNNEATNESELALGWLDFVQMDGSGHCINIAVSRQIDSRLFLVFFEPQTQQITPRPLQQENSEDFISF